MIPQHYIPLLKQYKKTIFWALCYSNLILLLASCNVVKRVKPNEYLLTKNTILIDSLKNKEEVVNNLVIQKTNTGINGLGLPIGLHVYNLARPNIDSIIQNDLLNNEKKVKRKIKFLSKKQFIKTLQSRKEFNSWLKRTGEAPVILSEDKTEKTAKNLKGYFFSKGWFNVEVNYEIKKDSSKKAQVIYNVAKKNPYFINEITPYISTKSIDSLYKTISKESLLKKGMQYDALNYENERKRLTTELRNKGYYHFDEDNIRFENDTIGTNYKVNSSIYISNRKIRNSDSITDKPFGRFKIKEVNIYTDNQFDNQNQPIKDSLTYKNYNLYSKDQLKFRPKALTDAVFISKDDYYNDTGRSRTLKYLNNLQMFKYPSIIFTENEQDTTLTANVYLEPLSKFSLGFDFDVSQSNIQTIGFSVAGGLKIRNIFRGAEIFELSGIASVGSSQDAASADDVFFDINEIGANARFTFPRLLLPFNTDKIIPKYMSPRSILNFATTSQRHIGLDRRTLSGLISYNWKPSTSVNNTFELINIQYVRNLNVNNYFGVYSNSFSRLNNIARSINFIGPNETLIIPDQANTFITEVLSGNTTLTPTDENFVLVNNIEERKQRLTENNLILSSSFSYVKDKRTNLFDNDFSIFKWRIESAGTFLSNLSKLINLNQNNDGNLELFGVAFSQYLKTEVDYIKYFDLGDKKVLALRSYLGIAIPFGNSNSIPFVESFFAGGPNDNRAWTAFNLGPGSSRSIDEFNEANFKIHLSAEQRFPIIGQFRGALFLDVGNIWNVLDNTQQPEATFTSLNDLKNIAIGSGMGLRYDFNFFVLRFDIGFKTYDPFLPMSKRWFTNYNFSNAVYNIGINYPF